MEGFVVSAATGALKPVLEKLADLLGSEYKHFKQVRREIQFLIDELEPMHAFLLKMSEKNPDEQEKARTKEVRGMSYDTEDCIDDFMLHVDGGGKSFTPLTGARTC
ncbi:hypothetical protein U9M48_039263 [Paspalum notatum var. saurae]|uniref:Disease resistance N-terminal domain-containing protein n=1 Tax=Paspalum notatum var. saurae TaxID=547442 RepID=A0AAQ3XBW4_PASNO